MARACPIFGTPVICTRDCAACREEHIERCSILEYGQGTSQRDTQRPRAEAESLARSQLAASLPGQRSLA